MSQVWYTLRMNGTPTAVIDQIGSSSVAVLDLTPATTYTFVLSARDAYGNTAESNSVTVTTPAVTDHTAPAAPSNLRGFESAGCEAWLSWDAATDDSDPPSALRYDVYVNGVLAQESTTIGYTSTIAYARATGANTFVVTATDSSGNVSAASNELTFAGMQTC